MADALTIKRNITVQAVVTTTWKQEAERELSQGITTTDQQLAQLEQEGQQVIEEIRRQSANPLDPRVQEQVAGVQQQVAAKRAELEEQKRNLLDQQTREDLQRLLQQPLNLENSTIALLLESWAGRQLVLQLQRLG